MSKKILLLFASLTIALTIPLKGLSEEANTSIKQQIKSLSKSEQNLIEKNIKNKKELEDLQKAIQNTHKNKEKVSQEIKEIDNDINQFNTKLIHSANDIQNLEERMSLTEERILNLDNKAQTIHLSLKDRRALLSRLISAMIRLGRTPPPAIAVAANDALGSVRSAIMLGRIFPEIKTQTQALAKDLNKLEEIKTALNIETQKLIKEHVTIKKERQRMAMLLDERQKIRQQNTTLIKNETARLEALSTQAQTINQLLSTIEKEVEKIRARKKRIEQIHLQNEKNRQKKKKLATRISPEIPFSKALYSLQYPAKGTVIKNYGQQNKTGHSAKGIEIATRERAKIIAPSDGLIAYAGSFRSYGKILILDVGEKYHIVMTGMKNINAKVGQFVLKGEPIATMGDSKAQMAQTNVNTQSVPTNATQLTQPRLYIEFRKNGTPIDSKPWWAKTINQGLNG